MAADENAPDPRQASFVVRFWLERADQGPFWRGSVEETGLDGCAKAYVQDGASLLAFLRKRLLRHNGAVLPRNRSRARPEIRPADEH